MNRDHDQSLKTFFVRIHCLLNPSQAVSVLDFGNEVEVAKNLLHSRWKLNERTSRRKTNHYTFVIAAWEWVVQYHAAESQHHKIISYSKYTSNIWNETFSRFMEGYFSVAHWIFWSSVLLYNLKILEVNTDSFVYRLTVSSSIGKGIRV